MSRKLSYLLRHDKEYDFDPHGWRSVADLVQDHGFTFNELSTIVADNGKHRFEFNDDMTLIRARQGHSIPVDVELAEAMPPAVLFHGTSEQSLSLILKEGIKKGSRLYVHLSTTEEAAIEVGRRHGKPVVLKIDSGRMAADGVKFFLSRNGVWLTEKVEKGYLLR